MTTPAAAALRPSTAPVALSAVADRIGLRVASAAHHWTDVAVTGITHDSRAVVPGDLYAALSGEHHHGAEFVDDVVGRGAVAVLTDAAGAERVRATGLPTLVVDDVRRVLGAAAAAVYGDPASQLTMLGITGTNGKTTTAYLLEAAMRACGRTTGLIGTIATLIDGVAVGSVRTTPEATDLHALLAVMRERGVDTVVMEVSSHALVMGRVDAVHFDVVGFTNLSQDHLDYHGSMEAYFEAKASLFTAERARRGVVMLGAADQQVWTRRLVEAATIPLVVVGAAGSEVHDGDPDVTTLTVEAARYDQAAGVTTATVRSPTTAIDVCTRLTGSWNLDNTVLAVVMAAESSASADSDVQLAVEGAASVAGVPGRLERIAATRPVGTFDVRAFVDYAHTPDAVAAVLSELRSGEAVGRRLITVIGCGGDRDRTKRPLMGAAAARHADIVIVTDDNPRSEEPGSIRAAVLEGARSVASGVSIMEVGDRRRAIEAAVTMARPDGVVAVLGKGHESGQEVVGVITPFDDRSVLQQALDAAAPR